VLEKEKRQLCRLKETIGGNLRDDFGLATLRIYSLMQSVVES